MRPKYWPLTKAGKPMTKPQIRRSILSAMTEDELESNFLRPDFKPMAEYSDEELYEAYVKYRLRG